MRGDNGCAERIEAAETLVDEFLSRVASRERFSRFEVADMLLDIKLKLHPTVGAPR